jgi:hypothetical protein
MSRNLQVFDRPLIQVSVPLECQYSLSRRVDCTVTDIYCLPEGTVEKIKQLDVPMYYIHLSCRHGNSMLTGKILCRKCVFENTQKRAWKVDRIEVCSNEKYIRRLTFLSTFYVGYCD